MANWTVSTVDKKSCEEHEIWVKDGMEIRRISGFRWATFDVETNDDNPPVFEFRSTPGGSADLDSVDMYNCCENNIENVELVSMDDGWYGDIVFPDEMSEEEQERLTELWDEEYYDGWESDGWVLDETEAWIWGPIEVQNEAGETVMVINEVFNG